MIPAGLEPNACSPDETLSFESGGNFSTAFLSTFAALLRENYECNDLEVLQMLEAARRTGVVLSTSNHADDQR